MNSQEKALLLIVDDNWDIIELLKCILNALYDTAAVGSGFEALEFVQKKRPDLILLDVVMPGMDGFEVCRKLRDIPAAKDIPVIFLTGKSDKNSVIMGFETGAVDYIVKPFNQFELLARVATHLALKNAMAAEKKLNREKDSLIRELRRASEEIKELRSFIPICSSCKKIRGDKGYWENLEAYFEKHSLASFSHSLCPECMDEIYRDEEWYKKMKAP